MQVDVLAQTESPEETICTAARGDYYDGYVGDTDFRELMQSVNYKDKHLNGLADIMHQPESSAHHYVSGTIDNYLENDGSLDEYIQLEARKRAFIEKQLSRGHFGPWEHVSISFTIKNVSRALMAQITRHRHMTFDVQSQRYVDFSDKDAVIPKSFKYENHFSRDDGITELTEEIRNIILDKYVNSTTDGFELYQEMVDEGIPKEDARFVLPIGTPVNVTMSGNARAMMHVLNLRQKANSQWEVRQLANIIAEELQSWLPYTGHWWQENGPMKISP